MCSKLFGGRFSGGGEAEFDQAADCFGATRHPLGEPKVLNGTDDAGGQRDVQALDGVFHDGPHVDVNAQDIVQRWVLCVNRTFLLPTVGSRPIMCRRHTTRHPAALPVKPGGPTGRRSKTAG